MRLDFVAAKFQATTGLAAAPVLQIVGNADIFCVDSEGHILAFDHETNTLELLNLSFWELFEREITELKDRKVKKVSGSTKLR